MKIVFAAPVFPYPGDSGAKIRLLRHIKVLSAAHETTLVTVARTPEERELVPELSRLVTCEAVAAPNRRSVLHRAAYRAGYSILGAIRQWPPDAFYGCPGAFSRLVKRVAQVQKADLVHYDYWFSALGDLQPARYHRMMLEHDVEFTRRWRDYEQSPDPKLKTLAERTERVEKLALRSVDSVLTVTDKEAADVRSYGARLAVTLPTGVDTDQFCPPPVEPEEPEIVFVGAFSHHPNVDAALWFADEILPLVRKSAPDARFVVVGSDPPPDITRLHERPGIEVTGRVPEVVPYYQRACVFVAPLRIGSGIKGKIIEAMATGRAIVTTPVGAEGMNLKHGSNVCIADGAEPFAAEVVGLLTDPKKREQIGAAARELALVRHSQEAADKRLLDIYANDIWSLSKK